MSEIIDISSASDWITRVYSDYSVLEVLNELFVIEISPIIYLDLLVEGLKLLFNLILRCSVNKLFLCRGNVRSVQDQQNLSLDSTVISWVLKLENAVSKINIIR